MHGNYDIDVERQLQADGFVPAGLDCLWIGDEYEETLAA